MCFSRLRYGQYRVVRSSRTAAPSLAAARALRAMGALHWHQTFLVAPGPSVTMRSMTTGPRPRMGPQCPALAAPARWADTIIPGRIRLGCVLCCLWPLPTLPCGTRTGLGRVRGGRMLSLAHLVGRGSAQPGVLRPEAATTVMPVLSDGPSGSRRARAAVEEEATGRRAVKCKVADEKSRWRQDRTPPLQCAGDAPQLPAPTAAKLDVRHRLRHSPGPSPGPPHLRPSIWI